jgi:hypothetical protein
MTIESISEHTIIRYLQPVIDSVALFCSCFFQNVKDRCLIENGELRVENVVFQ